MTELKEGNVFEGQIEFSTNGNAFLLQEDKDIFIFKKNTGNALHLDTVKIEVFKLGNKFEGKVIEIISRFKTQYVGQVKINKSTDKSTTFVVPDSPKVVVDFFIKGGLKAEHDQKVVVEFIEWNGTKSPQAKIIKILGNSGDNNTEMNSIMFEYGLPMEFPTEVITESESIEEIITEQEIISRKDFRGITTITIDPADAKDFDDSLSIGRNEKGIEIGVHIADVAHYVKEGTLLDDEAYKRATSVYLVDRCVSMIPERLSNGICSLKPNVDRLAFSVVFTLDENGNILDTWQGKTIIHSNRRYSYEEAQSIIEGNAGDFSTEMRLLNDLAKQIREKRIKAGSIEMGRAEVKFKLDIDNKKPIGVYFKEQKEANKLIEEFMLLANKSVAKKLKKELKICVNRAHPEPSLEKLTQLKAVAESLGYEFSLNKEEIKENLNKLLKDIKGTPEENMLGTIIVRCQSKAFYTTEPISHWGLDFEDYCHFTSPIRRYSDLQISRLLEEALKV